MEVHAQATSSRKLFSGAATAFGGEPNSHVSLIDAASMPGMLPVINEECVRQAVRTVLWAEGQGQSQFGIRPQELLLSGSAAGLPDQPVQIADRRRGEVLVDLPDGDTARIGIERLHLEQDAGQSLHDQHVDVACRFHRRRGVDDRQQARSGAAEEAEAFVGKLRTILRYLGTCDGDMEKGHLRADVNVSVRKPVSPGTRCEIKNLNSIRFIGQAIEHEARRQIEIIEDGGAIEQETRLFDPDKGETRSTRSKEEAHDYRYFPASGPVAGSNCRRRCSRFSCRAHLPELPDDKKARFTRATRCPNTISACWSPNARPPNSSKLSSTAAKRAAARSATRSCCHWVINELAGLVEKEGKSITASPVSAVQLGAILDLLAGNTISGKIAKDVFEIVWTEGRRPRAIVEARGLKQLTDLSAIWRSSSTTSLPGSPRRSPTPRPTRRRSAGSSVR